MVEGKGYCARKQERQSVKKIAEFIRNKDKIVIIPDLTEINKKKRKTIR